MSETIYFVPNAQGGEKRKMHTNPDCGHLKSGHKIVEKDREIMEGHLEMCKGCEGYQRHVPDENSANLRKQLLESDPEDFGLSPLEGR